MVDHSFSNVSRQVREEGGWIYSMGGIGGWVGGYWRVAGCRIVGGYWRVGGNFLEGGRRSAKKTGKTRCVKNVELITICFFGLK